MSRGITAFFYAKMQRVLPSFRFTDGKAQAVCYTCSNAPGGYQAKPRLSRLNAGYQAR
jgi:hypothetical protein